MDVDIHCTDDGAFQRFLFSTLELDFQLTSTSKIVLHFRMDCIFYVFYLEIGLISLTKPEFGLIWDV